ncbi:DUF402 domain-containing protein [Nucisporomicrobium flavum]|uniref:DUF402 domain-containing protein n=1 Tax=Nucisporomicrobium flavum TaxID=2785915 RepID=UPI0018F4C503|nr:DUF402 domain-containing protein [Nucisporomicrobium flavum]
MTIEAAAGTVRLEKIKRPGGVFWFDLQRVGQDDDGTWLRGPVGSPWVAPHDCGTLPMPVVVLLAEDRPWAAWWVGDPADQRLEIDVCLPPTTTGACWRYVDLELDPVLHRPSGRVEIEDWDEYEEAALNGWMNADEAGLAQATAEHCAEVLRRGAEPWIQRGWQMLRDM